MLEVKYLPTGSLAPYERNARTHSPEQIKHIAASIKEFGFTNPLLIDENRGIIAGHGRLAAALTLGFTEVPTIELCGLSPTQRQAYVLADNQLALNAGWDMDLLSNELADLQAQGFDLGLTGFSDIDALLAGRGTAGLTDPDAVPEPGARAVATLGDVWLLGGHRLVCGDSTDAAAVGACLGQERPHLMVTDPPYGVNYDATWRGKAGCANLGKNRTGLVANDDRASWREVWALFPGTIAYIWHGGLHSATVAESLVACDFQLRSQIIWNKTVMVMGRGDYHWQHEPCWYAVKGTGKWEGDRKQTTVWTIASPLHIMAGSKEEKTAHPTQKPVECMRRPMENNSVAGNAVYEPFSGSGTTIIAGEQCARRVLAIELNPIYVDVAIKRWQQFTGKLATLEATGQSFEDVADARYDWRKDGFESYEVWCAAKREELVKAGKAA
jgi:DNA modification methylase